MKPIQIFTAALGKVDTAVHTKRGYEQQNANVNKSKQTKYLNKLIWTACAHLHMCLSIHCIFKGIHINYSFVAFVGVKSTIRPDQLKVLQKQSSIFCYELLCMHHLTSGRIKTWLPQGQGNSFCYCCCKYTKVRSRQRLVPLHVTSFTFIEWCSSIHLLAFTKDWGLVMEALRQKLYCW